MTPVARKYAFHWHSSALGFVDLHPIGAIQSIGIS
jgi:hypothetical protein